MKAVFGGKKQVSIFKMTKLVSNSCMPGGLKIIISAQSTALAADG